MNLTKTDISENIEKINDLENLDEISEIYELSDDDTYRDCLMLDGDHLSSSTAEVIAGWLIAKYRSKIIFNYIDEIFGELSDFERSAVYDSVCNIISGKYGLEHLEYIKSKITDFFETENTMNVDGFINFRLKAYKDEIKTLVEECGYDVIAYRDLQDMIDVINFLFDVTEFE